MGGGYPLQKERGLEQGTLPPVFGGQEQRTYRAEGAKNEPPEAASKVDARKG